MTEHVNIKIRELLVESDVSYRRLYRKFLTTQDPEDQKAAMTALHRFGVGEIRTVVSKLNSAFQKLDGKPVNKLALARRAEGEDLWGPPTGEESHYRPASVYQPGYWWGVVVETKPNGALPRFQEIYGLSITVFYRMSGEKQLLVRVWNTDKRRSLIPPPYSLENPWDSILGKAIRKALPDYDVRKANGRGFEHGEPI